MEKRSFSRFPLSNLLGHWLGLDAHDVGEYRVNGEPRVFESGMVLTIEPGVYLRHDEASVPRQWRGMGVRIEDVVVVTPRGHEILSADIPKSIDALEAMIGSCLNSVSMSGTASLTRRYQRMPSTLSLEASCRGDMDNAASPSEPLIVVLGQGLVAHLAAFALARAGFSILRVGRFAPSDAQFMRDERTLALAKFSVDFLYDLGLWTELEADAVPIRSIHVSEQGETGGNETRRHTV